jgi:hypothetical protein
LVFKNLIAKVSPHLGAACGNCTITRLIALASVSLNSLIVYPRRIRYTRHRPSEVVREAIDYGFTFFARLMMIFSGIALEWHFRG